MSMSMSMSTDIHIYLYVAYVFPKLNYKQSDPSQVFLYIYI